MSNQDFSIEQLYRSLADHSPDLIWAKDLQGRYLFVNQALCERLLITDDPQEPLGKTNQFFFNRQRTLFPDNPHYHTFGARCPDSDQIVIRDQKAQQFVEFGNVQGEMLYLDVFKAPLFNDRQELIGTMGLGRIVDREHDHLQQLQSSRERKAIKAYNELEQIFNVTFPLCILSLECKVTKVNRAFCTFMQMEEEEILGKTGEALWQCSNCWSETCCLNRFKHGENPIVEELEKKINGQDVWCTIHAAPYVDPEGEIQGAIVTFLDTTEHKRIQQSLDNTQRQLLQAEKLSAVGALTASITHELNNPVCGIKNVLQRMLRKGGLEQESASLMELAAQECSRIEQMVRDLQDFNLPPAMEREAFDFHEMLDSVILFLRRYIKSHAVTFVTEYNGPLWVFGVKDQLKQVCLSLLTSGANAIEKGHLVLSTVQHPDHITLLIHDDGLGISDEELKQLFDPMCSFATEKMIGLKGIATAQTIMRSQGGDVQVQAASGKGTIIKLLLPQEKQDERRS